PRPVGVRARRAGVRGVGAAGRRRGARRPGPRRPRRRPRPPARPRHHRGRRRLTRRRGGADPRPPKPRFRPVPPVPQGRNGADGGRSTPMATPFRQAPFRPTRRSVLAAVPPAALAAAWAPPARAAAARPGQSAPAGAFRPEAAYSFPDSVPDGEPGEGVVWRSLLDYAPEDDPDLPYNAATVPLAERVAPVPAHPGAPADGARVQSLVSFAPTAGHHAQGGPGARHYAFTHWAYLEELVFWGGSSAEGLILAPTAPVVDAAHRNGVPVLGTVFLPPRTYGGDLQWTRDLVRRDEGGEYPVAAKLAEVADAYGFDGWFVNAETEGGDSALADAVRGFLKRLRTLSGKRITWYDAMTTSGAIDWRNRLDEANEPFFHDADGPVAHTMFVNFDWTAEGLAASAERARALGRHRRGGARPGHPGGRGRAVRRRPGRRGLHRAVPAGMDAHLAAGGRRARGVPPPRGGVLDRPRRPPRPGRRRGVARDRRARPRPVRRRRTAVRHRVQRRPRHALRGAGPHRLHRGLAPPGRAGRAAAAPLGPARGRGAAARRRPRLHRALPRRQLPARARSRPGGGRDRPVPGPAGHRRPGRRRGGAD